MSFIIKGFIVLLVALSSLQMSTAQTYITPVVGYEWSTAEALNNSANYGFRFRVLNEKKKYPLESRIIGFRANRMLSSILRLNTGIMYSTHQFEADMVPAAQSAIRIDNKLKRLRVLLGLEREIIDNVFISGDLTINHLFGIKTKFRFFGTDYIFRESNEKSRMHLGIQFGVAWHWHNFIIRPYYEYGFWTLKSKSEFTATSPIKGLGISLGYQFEL